MITMMTRSSLCLAVSLMLLTGGCSSAAKRKLLKSLGAAIKEIREKKKLTVYDVTGDDMPIKSRQHWQKIEAGQLSLTFVTFHKIAATLKVSASDLTKSL